jgi:hypothetical protein
MEESSELHAPADFFPRKDPLPPGIHGIGVWRSEYSEYQTHWQSSLTLYKEIVWNVM